MAQYVFGPFLLDIEERRLLRDNAEVRLRGKLFDALSVLVENSGHLIRKEDINHLVMPQEPAWNVVIEAVSEFMEWKPVN